MRVVKVAYELHPKIWKMLQDFRETTRMPMQQTVAAAVFHFVRLEASKRERIVTEYSAAIRAPGEDAPASPGEVRTLADLPGPAGVVSKAELTRRILRAATTQPGPAQLRKAGKKSG